MKRLWLKTWPKLFVTGFGIACYAAVGWLPEARQSLVEGIAINLISIPVIFLIYEIWNDKSHQKLYESIYRYAGNEMSLAMAEARREIESVLHGIDTYTEGLPLMLDDRNLPAVGLVLRPGVRVEEDEDGDLYLAADDRSLFVCDVPDDDLFSLDKATIVPLISETFYVGHQVHSFRIDKVAGRVDGLIRNAFVMERMDDRQATIIVALHQSLRALQAFLSFHDDLFLCVGMEAGGLATETGPSPMPGWHAADLVLQVRDDDHPGYTETLDSGVFPTDALEYLTTLYVVNPDHYIVFSDLIHEVIHCIGRWRTETGQRTFLDFDHARIGVI